MASHVRAPWALSLVGLILVLDAFGAVVYRASHPHETASLHALQPPGLGASSRCDHAQPSTLPLRVFLVDGRFNVAETIRRNHDERTQRASRTSASSGA